MTWDDTARRVGLSPHGPRLSSLLHVRRFTYYELGRPGEAEITPLPLPLPNIAQGPVVRPAFLLAELITTNVALAADSPAFCRFRLLGSICNSIRTRRAGAPIRAGEV